jgi:hypothetical protein
MTSASGPVAVERKRLVLRSDDVQLAADPYRPADDGFRSAILTGILDKSQPPGACRQVAGPLRATLCRAAAPHRLPLSVASADLPPIRPTATAAEPTLHRGASRPGPPVAAAGPRRSAPLCGARSRRSRSISVWVVPPVGLTELAVATFTTARQLAVIGPIAAASSPFWTRSWTRSVP